MDRNIVYAGAVPLDTDILQINRNAMIAIGYLAQAMLGTSTVIDGLSCTPSLPPSMTVNIGPGSITAFSVVDTTPYGSLPADASDPLLKMGINLVPTPFTILAPTTPGLSINYLIEAMLLESDGIPSVLTYYNASAPAQPFFGPANAGTSQNTLRSQKVQLQLKSGVPASTGTQLTPSIDNGWIGLYAITVSYGQTAITGNSIVALPTAPFLNWKLPQLCPGFGSGVQGYTASGLFTVPLGVRQVEVELWGGGSGSYASVPGLPSGGGAGGGYARKRISSLSPGLQIPVTVGMGGNGGTVAGTAASPGGTSSFGTYVSATGGSLNYLALPSSPQNGATPAGVGVGGDANFNGSVGQAGILNQGGMGGAAPMGGSQNSGTTGVPGVFPGGGASGAGTGANGALPYDGAPGANGFVIVRW
jgi:hypothetical protein